MNRDLSFLTSKHLAEPPLRVDLMHNLIFILDSCFVKGNRKHMKCRVCEAMYCSLVSAAALECKQFAYVDQ